MRGSPLRQLLVIAAFILIAGALVWSLTRQRPALPAAERLNIAAATKKTVEVDLVLMASTPSIVEVLYVGKLKSEISSRVSTKLTLAQGEKTDLVIKATWPQSDSFQALRVLISWDGETIADRTFWGLAGIEDVLTFTAPTP